MSWSDIIDYEDEHHYSEVRSLQETYGQTDREASTVYQRDTTVMKNSDREDARPLRVRLQMCG